MRQLLWHFLSFYSECNPGQWQIILSCNFRNNSSIPSKSKSYKRTFCIQCSVLRNCQLSFPLKYQGEEWWLERRLAHINIRFKQISRFCCRYFVILYLSFPCYHRPTYIIVFHTYYAHVLCGKVPFCIRGKGIWDVKNIFNGIIDKYLRCFAKLGSHIDTAISWHD